MKKILALVIFVFLSRDAFACDNLLAKYGQAKTVDFCLFITDATVGAVKVENAVHASGDTYIMKDEAAEANTTNAFTDEGSCYSIVLTSTEMQAARVTLNIEDQSTKAWADKCVVIETYGNASAEHAFDLDTSTVVASSVSSGGIAAASFASGAIDATAIAADAIGASELASNAIGTLEIADSAFTSAKFSPDGTAQAGAAATITLASAESYADNALRDRLICITSGTGKGECGVAASNIQSTDVVTMYSNWVVTPDNTSQYVIVGSALSNTNIWNGTVVPTGYTPGYPVVTIKDGSGAGEIDTDAGEITGCGGSVSTSATRKW